MLNEIILHFKLNWKTYSIVLGSLFGLGTFAKYTEKIPSDKIEDFFCSIAMRIEKIMKAFKVFNAVPYVGFIVNVLIQWVWLRIENNLITTLVPAATGFVRGLKSDNAETKKAEVKNMVVNSVNGFDIDEGKTV